MTSWPNAQWTEVVRPTFDRIPVASGAQPPESNYPIAPAALPSAPDEDVSQPANALRMARPKTGAPQSVGDLAIDPASLRQRLKLHAGGAALSVDDRRLSVRGGADRKHIPWTDVLGFEPHWEGAGPDGVMRGSIVVMTTTGPVPLLATRGSVAEVRYAQAMLDAYRARAYLAHYR
jgi:hypothetical protein